jgi:hypothetical protein
LTFNLRILWRPLWFLFLTINAAKTSGMYNSDQICVELLYLQYHKSLTIC